MTLSTHGAKMKWEITYEKDTHYIFYLGYNDFGNLYRIHQMEAFFMVRVKRNVKFKAERWKRRRPENVLLKCHLIKALWSIPKR